MHEHDYEKVCGPLRPMLVKYALTLTRGLRAQAQDLVQETMIKAFLKWHRFRVPEGTEPAEQASRWLHKILKNKHRDAYRRERPRANAATAPSDVTGLRGPMTVAGIDGDPTVKATRPPTPARTRLDAEIARSAVESAVSREMATMSDEARQGARWLVGRVAQHGDTPAEIARDTGLSHSLVKVRIHRARRQLAEALAQL